MDVPAVWDGEVLVGNMGGRADFWDSATRPIGTSAKIWPGCFGRRAGFWGVSRQIAEIGLGVGQRDRWRHRTFRLDRGKCVAVICALGARCRPFGQSAAGTVHLTAGGRPPEAQADRRRPRRMSVALARSGLAACPRHRAAWLIARDWGVWFFVVGESTGQGRVEKTLDGRVWLCVRSLPRGTPATRCAHQLSLG